MGAFPVDSGAVSLAIELMELSLEGEKERVGGGVGVSAAIEVAAMMGDGLAEKAGIEGGDFFGPLGEVEVAGEEETLGAVLDGGGGGYDDSPDAGVPLGVDDEFAGVGVVFAGVAGDFFLTRGGGGAFGKTGVGAVGG